MNKQEFENKIEALEKQIEELKNEVNSPKFEGFKKGVRQMPKIGEEYYYLTDEGRVNKAIWNKLYRDNLRFDIGNYFRTEQEALDYRENILTKQALKDLALELNNGVEVDWKNFHQEKYRIFIEGNSYLESEYVGQYTDIGQVYCLDENFLGIAKERIGEEKLIKLIKSGV